MDERVMIWNGIPVPHDATIGELRAFASGPEPKRWVAFVALAAKNDLEALDVLESFVNDTDPHVRRAAVDGIAHHAKGSSLGPVVLRLLDDPDQHVVRAACDATASLKLTSAYFRVLSLLKHSIAETRISALRAFRVLWRDEAFTRIVTIFQHDPEDEVKKEAGWTLQKNANSENATELCALWVRDQIPRHRIWACELAEEYRIAAAIPSLRELERDSDGHVRQAAFHARSSFVQ